MAKVLFINPDYYETVYASSKVRFAMLRGNIPLGLLYVGAAVRDDGHEVKILDLNLSLDPNEHARDEITSFNPDFVGITASTANIKRAYALAESIKKINKEITIIAGGPHTSAYPDDVLKESKIDCVVKGEGDFSLRQIIRHGFSRQIPNIYYKHNGGIVEAEKQGCVTDDLDKLPYPAYDLLDIKKYVQSDLLGKKQPAGFLEVSRGCYARCIYCNKGIFGFRVRQKSAVRVVDEIQRMLKLGFKEIHIIDDIFTANKQKVFDICEEIIKRKLKFPWHPHSGVRADSVSPEILRIMKKAGCYRILYGVESGSQRVLDHINKGITLTQVETAVKWAKKVKMQTVCAFMLALPTETEDDINKTIDFAIRLNPDYAKWTITVPLPGTPLFNQMESKGQIKTKDWNKYIFHRTPKDLYEHDILSWETIEKYYDLCYKRFYLNPRYAFKMLCKTILDGSIFAHIKIFLKTKW